MHVQTHIWQSRSDASDSMVVRAEAGRDGVVQRLAIVLNQQLRERADKDDALCHLARDRHTRQADDQKWVAFQVTLGWARICGAGVHAGHRDDRVQLVTRQTGIVRGRKLYKKARPRVRIAPRGVGWCSHGR